MVGKSCARRFLIGQSDRLEVLIESLDLFLLPEVGGSLMKLEQILQIVVQLRLDEFFGFSGETQVVVDVLLQILGVVFQYRVALIEGSGLVVRLDQRNRRQIVVPDLAERNSSHDGVEHLDGPRRVALRRAAGRPVGRTGLW